MVESGTLETVRAHEKEGGQVGCFEIMHYRQMTFLNLQLKQSWIGASFCLLAL